MRELTFDEMDVVSGGVTEEPEIVVTASRISNDWSWLWNSGSQQSSYQFGFAQYDTDRAQEWLQNQQAMQLDVQLAGGTPEICSFTGNIGGGLFGLAAVIMGSAVAGPWAGGAFGVIMAGMFTVAVQNACVQLYNER